MNVMVLENVQGSRTPESLVRCLNQAGRNAGTARALKKGEIYSFCLIFIRTWIRHPLA